jgi:hypothetical protein
MESIEVGSFDGVCAASLAASASRDVANRALEAHAAREKTLEDANRRLMGIGERYASLSEESAALAARREELFDKMERDARAAEKKSAAASEREARDATREDAIGRERAKTRAARGRRNPLTFWRRRRRTVVDAADADDVDDASSIRDPGSVSAADEVAALKKRAAALGASSSADEVAALRKRLDALRDDAKSEFTARQKEWEDVFEASKKNQAEMRKEIEERRRWNEEMARVVGDALAEALETNRFMEALRGAIAHARREQEEMYVVDGDDDGDDDDGNGNGDGGVAGGGGGAGGVERGLGALTSTPILTHPPLFIADMGDAAPSSDGAGGWSKAGNAVAFVDEVKNKTVKRV